jgi:N-acetylglucosamine transport system substrate-binding protein
MKRSLFTYQGIYAGYLESVFYPAIAGAAGLNTINDIGNYKEGVFLTPAVRSVVNTFARIGTGGFLMEGTVALNHTQSQTDMMLGKALFIPNGIWMEGEMADAPRESGFEFAILPPPVLRSGQDRYVLSSSEQHQIPKQAKNPQLAKDFLRFLYTRDSIISFARNSNGTIAVSDAKDIARSYLTPGVYGMFTAYDTGKFMLMSFAARPAGSRVDVGKVVFDDTMGPLMTGRLTPEAYCRNVESAFAEIRADIAAAR